ncbi:MAG: hypothetical protein R3F60_21580 [bacterium]
MGEVVLIDTFFDIGAAARRRGRRGLGGPAGRPRWPGAAGWTAGAATAGAVATAAAGGWPAAALAGLPWPSSGSSTPRGPAWCGSPIGQADSSIPPEIAAGPPGEPGSGATQAGCPDRGGDGMAPLAAPFACCTLDDLGQCAMLVACDPG